MMRRDNPHFQSHNSSQELIMTKSIEQLQCDGAASNKSKGSTLSISEGQKRRGTSALAPQTL